MNPATAIADCQTTVGVEMVTKARRLELACAEAEAQWSRLVAMGAGREDHAAAILGGLLNDLKAIEWFAKRCREQIEAMKADPFERGAAPAADNRGMDELRNEWFSEQDAEAAALEAEEGGAR